MPDLLNETDFTEHLASKLRPLSIEVEIPQPLIVELHYGQEEPVLSIPLKHAYDQYVKAPEMLDSLIDPYVLEIGWTVQPPRYQAREIFEKTMPVMKDLIHDPVLQDGEAIVRDGKEIVLRLPKGPVLYRDLVTRDDERLVVQFMIERGEELLDLYRGDILTCFPEPGRIEELSMQNLARRALESGLTTRVYRVENFGIQPILISFRNERLSEYVASLINVSDVMLALERNLDATEGMLVTIPSRDQMFISTAVDDQAVCEMFLLARHIKSESRSPVSGLIWRFQQGEVSGVHTVNLKEERG